MPPFDLALLIPRETTALKEIYLDISVVPPILTCHASYLPPQLIKRRKFPAPLRTYLINTINKKIPLKAFWNVQKLPFKLRKEVIAKQPFERRTEVITGHLKMEWHLENNFTFRVCKQFCDGEIPSQWHRTANTKYVNQVRFREVVFCLKTLSFPKLQF